MEMAIEEKERGKQVSSTETLTGQCSMYFALMM